MSTISPISQALKSSGVRWITAGWLAFIGENLILSENRQAIIDAIGDQEYHILYGTLSTTACSSILYGYLKHGRGGISNPPVRSVGILSYLSAFTCQSVGLIGLSQLFPTFQNPFVFHPAPAALDGSRVSSSAASAVVVPKAFTIRCPMDFRPKDHSTDGSVHGMERVSRHATFWSVGLVCLGRAITAVCLPEIVMFSFPAAFAWIGGAHQDSRFVRGIGGSLSEEKRAATSNVPFAAVLAGRQSVAALRDELKTTNAGLAIGLSLVMTCRKFLSRVVR